MATPVQNLWPEPRAVASTVVAYAFEDAGGYYFLVPGGTPAATLVSPNGYVSLDPTAPPAQFRAFSVGTSPVTIAPVGA